MVLIVISPRKEPAPGQIPGRPDTRGADGQASVGDDIARPEVGERAPGLGGREGVAAIRHGAREASTTREI